MDLISRQAAIDALGDIPMSWADTDAEIQAQEDWKQHREALLKLPTAEKKGKWTHGKDMPPMKHRNGKPKKFWPSLKYCSCCGHEAFDDSDWGEQLFDFCPNCGARMEE